MRCTILRSLPRNALIERRPTSSQWLQTTLQRRLESTSGKQSKTAYKYPELLTVFVAPYSQTITIGTVRVISFAAVLYGTLVWAPFLYASEEHSNWLVPAAILGPMVPLTYALMMGPFVTNIGVRLPNTTRRSKDALHRFATNVPPDTRLRLKFLRFSPFGHSTEIRFSNFRRLPPTWTRLANLEHVPRDHVQREELEAGGKVVKLGLKGWFVRAYFGRYWVNMTSTLKDRSPVPGVWDKMWEQIPWIGERSAGAAPAVKERRPVSMANRAAAPVKATVREEVAAKRRNASK